MTTRIVNNHIDYLLAADCMPAETMKRARRFLYVGDVNRLFDLPLSPDEMVQVGTVLLRAPANGRSSTYGEPRPVLAPPLRRRLRALVDEGGAHAEAALFVLGQDLKARAFNRALATRH